MKKIINLEKYIKNKVVREWTEALIFAGVVALVFRTWLYAPYRVPTGSMLNTIQIGDHLFVNKHAYGWVVPFTDTKLFEEKVQRGDIIVFPYPKDPSDNYIKRVVAVGGDQVRLVGEKVFVNGEPEVNPFVYYDADGAPVLENVVIDVPPGHLWVMGDNRRNSQDSRYWGFVEEKEVTGKGVIIYWSHDPSKSLLEGYRFERIARFLE